MKIKFTAFLISALCATSVLAQSSAPANSGPPKGQNPAIDAALAECAASVTKDANGRPDRAAMDECMSAKGFQKPSRGDKGRGAPPPPKACKSS